MKIDWWTLGLQAVNVLILVWLLSRFLFKPVAAIIAERQQAATRLLDEARAKREEAERERRAAAERQAQIAASRAEILSAAQADAEAARAQLLEDAKTQVRELERQAEAALQIRRQELERDAERRAIRLAVAISERLMARLPASARLSGFEAGLAQSVAQLPEGARQALSAAASDSQSPPLVLRAARAPDDAELAACTSALAGALGLPALARPLRVEVNAELIAGYELEGGGALLSNHLAADLQRIAARLASEQPAPETH